MNLYNQVINGVAVVGRCYDNSLEGAKSSGAEPERAPVGAASQRSHPGSPQRSRLPSPLRSATPAPLSDPGSLSDPAFLLTRLSLATQPLLPSPSGIPLSLPAWFPAASLSNPGFPPSFPFPSAHSNPDFLPVPHSNPALPSRPAPFSGPAFRPSYPLSSVIPPSFPFCPASLSSPPLSALPFPL